MRAIQRVLLTVALGLLAAGAARAADLLDLYERARDFDPVFQTAVFEREIAENRLREATAGLRPAISGNVDVSKTYQNIKSSDSLLFTQGRSDFFNDSFTISLSQPVYRYDRFSRVPQARAEVRQAVSLFVAAEQDLIYRLVEASLRFLAARDTLEFAAAERVAISQQLQATEGRLSAGLASMTDVHDARARYALAQAAETTAEDDVEDARLAVSGIVGRLPTDIATLSETFPLIEPDEPDVEAWVRAAMFQNPEVEAREAAVEVAEREVQRQRGARRPSLDLITSYGNRNSGGTEFGGGNETANTNIALRAAIPMYDGGVTAARARTASLRKSISLQELEQEKQRVERETRAAFQGVVNGIARVQALTKSVFSYEAVLAQRDEGLRAGLSTGVEVLDARRDLFRAKRDLTQSRYLYILNGLRLKRSAGILGIADLRALSASLQ